MLSVLWTMGSRGSDSVYDRTYSIGSDSLGNVYAFGESRGSLGGVHAFNSSNLFLGKHTPDGGSWSARNWRFIPNKLTPGKVVLNSGSAYVPGSTGSRDLVNGQVVAA